MILWGESIGSSFEFGMLRGRKADLIQYIQITPIGLLELAFDHESFSVKYVRVVDDHERRRQKS